MFHEIWKAATKPEALKAFDLFGEPFRAKYDGAVSCLEADRDPLLTFSDLPAQHWIHLRTSNPIESTFSSVRLRTNKTKGCGSRIAASCLLKCTPTAPPDSRLCAVWNRSISESIRSIPVSLPWPTAPPIPRSKA